MVALTIRGLTKSYGGDGGPAAVSDLSLDIDAGEFVTLLGPSGCGKTTTLRLIAGFMAPDAGTIHADGRLVSSAAQVVPPEERGMGMVFQSYAVWPHKTVFENVVFGLKVRGVAADKARARVKEALALVNLSGLESRLPSELSGGQQQRVALARSLVVEPKILLLDEPLSNLDAKLRERMRSELKQLQRRTGITFVYVTHDQAEALALSDRIAVIHGGRLEQLGTPQEVYAKPTSRVVADFMGLVNLVPATVIDADGGRGRLRTATGWTTDVGLPTGVTAGQSVEIAIRPENIRLQPGADGVEPPDQRATVAECTYLGSIVEYHVTLEDGTMLRVQTHPRQRLAKGEAVSVEIDASQLTVFIKAGSETEGGRADLGASA
ncbi:MAG: ABC transporter ATP-binding protein [Hyphomicrobiaceae bacterium]